ncbi:MAG: hypothetical protein H7A01_17910 [Hahellaceae bacterium]|nr:hypothetical protein [Hahellaceae bacterium]MCP5212184.1 hypothetical protein [Hahellaceae bacterium]
MNKNRVLQKQNVVSAMAFVVCAFMGLATTSHSVFAAEKANTKEEQTNIDYMFASIAQKVALLLKENPKFLPFGAGMDATGKVQYIWLDKKQPYTPEGAMLLVRNALIGNAEAGRLIGVSTIYRYGREDASGKIKEQVNIELEYANGYAVVRAVEIVDKNGELTVGKAGQQPMQAKIFTPSVVEALQKK